MFGGAGDPRHSHEFQKAEHERRVEDLGRDAQGSTLGHDVVFLVMYPLRLLWRLVPFGKG